MSTIQSFTLRDRELTTEFVETMHVKDGVECDVYTFAEDSTVDLGIVRVDSGAKTPLQKILKGDSTIEGFMSGSGTLSVQKPSGEVMEYVFPGEHDEVEVHIGDVMQWHAGKDGLEFYELCWPPYEDGRYENLPDDN